MIEIIQYNDYLDSKNKKKKKWAINYDKSFKEELKHLENNNKNSKL